jgi:DNA-binding FadR family transcriptional regulator
MQPSILPVPASGSLPDKIYAYVVESILRGDYAQTGKLPTETRLAVLFSVSRPTVREALSRLRSDGVVTSRRGAGSYIVRSPSIPPAAVLPIKSLADVERYYAFRTCVEAGAAAGAAEARTTADIDAMQEALEVWSRAVQGERRGIEEDVLFHRAIAHASHNQFFIATIEASVGPIRQFIELAYSVIEVKDTAADQDVRREHQAIVDAIVRRSPGDAVEAARSHMIAARRRIFEGTQLR